MNCDFIAPYYASVEKLVYGGLLQKHRTAYLSAAAGKRTALVLGDGDGRFTQALAAAYPDLAIDSIEMSSGMVAQANQRVSHSRVKVIHSDVFSWHFSGAKYDLVFSHFFLDCFEASAIKRLLQILNCALTSDAIWVISEFNDADGGWRKFITFVMYQFFRHTTGLKTDHLPDYHSLLNNAGFELLQQVSSLGGFIVSEQYKRV